MAIGWYNGWSPAERIATIPIQREALRSGRLRRPSHCSICGSTADVWLHDERYDRPLEAYSICRSCHRCLHERFERPEPWQLLVLRHHRADAWFVALTLDPASQHRPFTDTYPDGLPEPSADDDVNRLEKDARVG